MSRPSGRILVVEDEDVIGRILVETLTGEGYQVRWARNGSEALAVLQTWVPHVILLDLMMPVMDGWAFRTEQLRLGASLSDVPVIVLSAARERASRAEDLGVAEAITKPFDLQQVLDAVARWVR